jgi:hypothetical protein
MRFNCARHASSLPVFRRRRSATHLAIIFPTRRQWWRRPVSLGEKTGLFGTLRWRYLGTSPLTEDNAFRSPPTSIFNARIGYRFDNGWRIQLDALNLFNTQANHITYAYGSLIKTDGLYNLCFPTQIAPPPSAKTASWATCCIQSNPYRSG